MDYIFYQVAAVNGFDSFGHYLRAGLIVNQCSTYATVLEPSCTAKFPSETATASSAGAGRTGDPVLDATSAILRGADPDEVVSKRQQAANRRAARRALTQQRQVSVPPAPATSTPQGPNTAAQDGALLDYLFGGDG
jgi:hypothetical protein